MFALGSVDVLIAVVAYQMMMEIYQNHNYLLYVLLNSFDNLCCSVQRFDQNHIDVLRSVFFRCTFVVVLF